MVVGDWKYWSLFVWPSDKASCNGTSVRTCTLVTSQVTSQVPNILQRAVSIILTFTGCQDNGQPASWCLANKEILEKVFKQHAHWYFFISEWVWRWARRLDRSAKARLQWRHENGFSPAEETQGFGSVMIIAWDCSAISFLMIVLLFLYIKKKNPKRFKTNCSWQHF